MHGFINHCMAMKHCYTIVQIQISQSCHRYIQDVSVVRVLRFLLALPVAALRVPRSPVELAVSSVVSSAPSPLGDELVP